MARRVLPDVEVDRGLQEYSGGHRGEISAAIQDLLWLDLVSRKPAIFARTLTLRHNSYLVGPSGKYATLCLQGLRCYERCM